MQKTPKLPPKSPKKFAEFLTKDSYTVAWDADEQYSNIERMYADLVNKFGSVSETADNIKETNSLYKETSKRAWK